MSDELGGEERELAAWTRRRAPGKLDELLEDAWCLVRSDSSQHYPFNWLPRGIGWPHQGAWGVPRCLEAETCLAGRTR